ncbi:MAG: hypothetical protein J6P40_12160 [Oscillospiraceae bacterium]|nr:hypothetical protein [Oscillospiraceae bacterium]
MQTLRIHFQDLSFIDAQLSDAQVEEFKQWLRFANQNWTYSIQGDDKEIKRNDISRIELIWE